MFATRSNLINSKPINDNTPVHFLLFLLHIKLLVVFLVYMYIYCTLLVFFIIIIISRTSLFICSGLLAADSIYTKYLHVKAIQDLVEVFDADNGISPLLIRSSHLSLDHSCQVS